MDVLQVLKTEFKERIVDLGDACALAGWISRFEFHLALESEFLLPELQAVSGPDSGLYRRFELELESMAIQLSSLRDGKSESDPREGLKKMFLNHFAFVEEKIFPLMRQKISTVDREALVSVVEEFRAEFKSVSAAGLSH
jgi:hypothetical protein